MAFKETRSWAIIFFLIVFIPGLHAQNEWRLKACLPSNGRSVECAFTLGGKGYVIGGQKPNGTVLAEVWQYDPTTNIWVQKNNFPMPLAGMACFVINNTAYAGIGLDNSGSYHSEFWQYNQGLDQWTLIPDLPGPPRYLGMAFSVNGIGYVGCGRGGSFYNDYYAYNPVANSWSVIASFPGTARQTGVGFGIGNFGYAGLGYDLSANACSDMYKYDPSINAWTQLANFAGTARWFPGFFIINDTCYITGGRSSVGLLSDCWRYDVPTDSWHQEQSYNCIAAGRSTGYGFTFGEYGYITCGDLGGGVFTNDLLEFGPYDTSFITRVHVLGNDTSYCGNFSRVLSTVNSCTVWSTGAIGQQITITMPGTYWAYFADTCDMAIDTITIKQGIASFSLGNDTTYCGSFTRILSTGVANTLWSTGITASQITVTTPGTYWASISNSCGNASDTIHLLQSTVPVVSLGNDTSLCAGQSLLLDAGNLGSVYKWQDNSAGDTYNVTTAGIYSVTVTNNASCSASDAIQVSYTTQIPTVNIGADTTYCGPFTRTLSTGVANTLWSTGVTASQITVTTPGTYWASISNSCGNASDTIHLLQSTVPVVNLGNDTSLCTGQSLLLDAGNLGSVYKWQDNSAGGTYNVTTAGIYSVTVTNNASCSASDAIQVSYTTQIPTVSIGADTAYCGAFTRILTTGVANTLWSTGASAAQITVNTAGSYWAEESNGCGSTSDTIVIVENPIPVISLGNDTTLCSGQSLLLDATAANASYHWQDNSTNATFNVTSPGIYSVTITNSFSCSSVDSVQVSYDSQIPDINLGNDTIYCNQFSRVLLTGITNTIWSDNETGPQIDINNPGLYWAQASNACGTYRDSILIGESSPPEVIFTSLYSVCPGDTVLLQPSTSGSNFLWDNGETTRSIYITQAGAYSIEAWNNIACPNYATINVMVGNPPVAYLGADTSICGNTGLTLSLSIPDAHYVWQDNSVDSFYLVTVSGTYTVTVSDKCGSSAAQRVVEIYQDECALLVPTGFSPNGDGQNDIFHAISRCPVSRFSIKVYNRWGEMIYESDNINAGWDGTYKQKPQPVGAFVYYIEYFNYCKNAMDTKSGNVTLIR